MSWERLILKEILKQAKAPIQILKEKEYKLVTISNNGSITLRKIEKGIQISADKAYAAKKGAFIYSRLSVHNGAFGIVPDDLDGALITSEMPIFDINANTLPDFLIYSLKLPSFKLQLNNLTKGMGRTRVKEDSFLSLYIDIPSIDEQKSIINEISDKEQLVTNISKLSLYQLDLLKKLRQQILQDAVQGKLVPQDLNDEPASVLLEQIKAEKEKLVREKKIKKGKLQEAETQEELLFDIPKNWIWCNLDEICANITDGTHQTPSYTQNGRIFLSAQNVKPFKFMPEDHKYVSEDAYQEYIKNRKPEKGDILVARVGAGIGEAAVINQEIDFCFYVSLGLVQPIKELTNSEFLTMVINSPYGVKYAKGNISSKGGSAGNFNLGRIRSLLIPLPPLAEQQRILTKIDQLMTLFDELEQTIQQNKKYTQELLQVALKEALEQKN